MSIYKPTQDELISCFNDTVNLSLTDNDIKENTAKMAASSSVYPEDYISGKPADPYIMKGRPEVDVVESTTFAAARDVILASGSKARRVAVLNFANPHTPGGGVTRGAMAQEECLCRSSNLYQGLVGELQNTQYYEYHKAMRDVIFSDRIIYSPGVLVFKDESPCPQLMPKEDWFSVDVITCAAPYMADTVFINSEVINNIFVSRIMNIFRVAFNNGVDTLILGAFGCGAFRNSPAVVASAFRQVIDNLENCNGVGVNKVVFAIKKSRGEDRICPNLQAFVNEFYAASSAVLRSSDDEEPNLGLRAESTWTNGYVMPDGTKLESMNERMEFGRIKWNNPYCGKNISIFGDSISTLAGYNPEGFNVFYEGSFLEITGVREPVDTWWGRIIGFLGANLLVNNSWSGCLVSAEDKEGDGFPSGCSKRRIEMLGVPHKTNKAYDVNPDVIIIYMGTNDWAYGIQPAVFKDGYDAMLNGISNRYPDATVWCCTLCSSKISSKPQFMFPTEPGGYSIETYNDIIKERAKSYDYELIDFASFKVPYDSIDGSHPNAEGMRTLTELVAKEMRMVTGINSDGTKFDASAPSAEKLTGKKIAGRYSIKKYLWTDGLQQRFKALDTAEGTECMMAVPENKDDGHVDYFIKKVEMLKNIRHDRLVNVYGYAEADSTIYMLEDYREHRRLLDADKEAKNNHTFLNHKGILKYMIDITMACAYLHSQNPPFVHRCITPKCILICDDGNARLSGLYSMIRGNDTGDMLMGRKGFEAPEQYFLPVSPAVDVYAIGRTMLSLLTDADMLSDRDSNGKSYITASVLKKKYGVDKKLAKIVEKCIEPDTKKRYKNAAELLEELKKCSL